MTTVPNHLKDTVESLTSFDKSIDYYMYILGRLIDTKVEIKNNTNIDSIITANFMRISLCK